MVWECQACSYILESKVDIKKELLPGEEITREDIADDWSCPVCGVGPEFLEEV